MSCTRPVRVWTVGSTSSTQHESTLFYVSAIYMHDNWAMKLQPLSCPSFSQTYIYSHPLLHNSSLKGLWSLTSCMSYLKGNVNSPPTLPPLLKGITGNIVLHNLTSVFYIIQGMTRASWSEPLAIHMLLKPSVRLGI